VVVIGIDEAAYVAIPEPTALWHAHLGLLFAGLSAAEPAVVGVAMPLPVRSYDFLVKDIDATLISGIYRLKRLRRRWWSGSHRVSAAAAAHRARTAGGDRRKGPGVAGDLRGYRRRRPPHQPASLPVRRQARSAGAGDGQAPRAPGFAHRHDRLQRRRQHRVHPDTHRPRLAASRRGRQAAALVKGRAVVVASLLPTESRHRLPVSLAGWEPGSRTEPAAVVHIQALRSLLARGLIERAPENLSLLLAALAPCSGSGAAAGSRACCWPRPWVPCSGFRPMPCGKVDYLRVANIVTVTLLATWRA
jgi:hypothetical protein